MRVKEIYMWRTKERKILLYPEQSGFWPFLWSFFLLLLLLHPSIHLSMSSDGTSHSKVGSKSITHFFGSGLLTFACLAKEKWILKRKNRWWILRVLVTVNIPLRLRKFSSNIGCGKQTLSTVIKDSFRGDNSRTSFCFAFASLACLPAFCLLHPHLS